MEDEKILNLSFNQAKNNFTVCMESGLRIYSVEPLVENARYGMKTMGSVSQCAMLHRTNLFAIVAGGSRPKFLDNILLIFDDVKKKFILEITFPLSIRGVRLSRDKIAVALLSGVYVFSFPSPTQKLFSLDTIRNPRGLCELGLDTVSGRQLLYFPGQRQGSVQIVDVTCSEVGISSAPVWISAHKSDLACLALNKAGTKLATASGTGTLIRVWDVLTKNQLLELRRGSDIATIYCINFSDDSEYLCCSSDKGTVHIFAVAQPALNKRSRIGNAAGILGEYGNSQWAFANFTVPPECPCICAFQEKSSVVAICLDGTFHKYGFNINGSCNREAFDMYLEVCDDEENLL